MRRPIKAFNAREWHPWFAWFPVPTQDGYWVWLETVQRRNECCEAADYLCGPIWQWRVAS